MDSLVSFQEALWLLAKEEPKPHKSATQQSLFILRLKGARKGQILLNYYRKVIYVPCATRVNMPW